MNKQSTLQHSTSKSSHRNKLLQIKRRKQSALNIQRPDVSIRNKEQSSFNAQLKIIDTTSIKLANLCTSNRTLYTITPSIVHGVPEISETQTVTESTGKVRVQRKGVKLAKTFGFSMKAANCARISFTARFNGKVQPQAASQPKVRIGYLNVGSFHDLRNELKFEPDVTTVFGQTSLNRGRQTAHVGRDYTYGGKKVQGQKAGPVCRRILQKLEESLGVPFNEAHIVYYPNGKCKLGDHKDDESTIAPNSIIAGVSYFAAPTGRRVVQLKFPEHVNGTIENIDMNCV